MFNHRKEFKKNTLSLLWYKFQSISRNPLDWINQVYAWEKEIIKTSLVAVFFLATYFVLTRLDETLPCWVDLFQLLYYPLKHTLEILGGAHISLILILYITNLAEPLVCIRHEYNQIFKNEKFNLKKFLLFIACYMKGLKFHAERVNESLTVITVKTPGKGWKKEEWNKFFNVLGFAQSDWEFDSGKKVYVMFYEEKSQIWEDD